MNLKVPLYILYPRVSFSNKPTLAQAARQPTVLVKYTYTANISSLEELDFPVAFLRCRTWRPWWFRSASANPPSRRSFSSIVIRWCISSTSVSWALTNCDSNLCFQITLLLTRPNAALIRCCNTPGSFLLSMRVFLIWSSSLLPRLAIFI